MKRGEIWLVSVDPMSGHGQKGQRPVLIVSPEAFNRVIDEVLARLAPIFE